jgi:MFS family permease
MSPSASPPAARTSRWQEWKELDPRVWRMAAARAINTMGLSLVMAFLGVYVVVERGYPAWVYGLITLSANLAQSVVNAWAGNLSDRIGRRPLITGALTVRALVIAALGTQVLLHAPLWSLALNMIVSSALRGCFEPVAYALVADVVAPAQRISAFSLQRMGTNLGWAIGPAAGGLLAAVVDYGVVFYVASLGLLIAARMTTKVADPIDVRRPRPDSGDGSVVESLREAARDPVMVPLLVGSFFAALLHTQLFSTFAIFMTERVGVDKETVGLVYAANGALVLLLQFPAVGLIHRIGGRRLLGWASLLEAAGFMLVGLAGGLGGGLGAIFVITCAEVLFDPSHQTAVAMIADPARRGRAFGVVGFTQMVGVACAPLVGGVLLDGIGEHHVAMWLVIGAIGVVQATAFALFIRRLDRRSPRALG